MCITQFQTLWTFEGGHNTLGAILAVIVSIPRRAFAWIYRTNLLQHPYGVTFLQHFQSQCLGDFLVILARELGGVLVFTLKLDDTKDITTLNRAATQRTLGLHTVLLLHLLHDVLRHGLIEVVGNFQHPARL